MADDGTNRAVLLHVLAHLPHAPVEEDSDDLGKERGTGSVDWRRRVEEVEQVAHVV
jgi:hypothetical protein